MTSFLVFYMIPPQRLKAHLEEIAQSTPHVFGKLYQGMELPRNLHRGAFGYVIDDVKVYRRVGNQPDDAFFRALWFLNSFDGLTFQIMFPPAERGPEGRIIAPFSRPIMRGYGECVEKSVLVQLAEQERGDCFLVYGLLAHAKAPRPSAHVWNVLWREGMPYLADAQNPAIVGKGGKKMEFPFVVPLEGMNERQFLIAESWAVGRSYSLPLR